MYSDNSDKSDNLLSQSVDFIFRKSPSAMAIMRLKDNIFIDINDKWIELFGFSRNEIVGKSATDIAIWKDKGQQLDAYCTLENYGSFRNENCELLKKNGEKLSAIVSFEKILINDKPMLVSSVIDITERKKAEEELKKSKQGIEQLKTFYENIVETIAEGLWKIDKEGKTTFVNKQMTDMLGYTKEEMLNRYFYDFAAKSHKELSKNKFEKRKLGLRDRYESKYVKKDGSFIWVSVSASPLYEIIGDKKQFVGAIGLVTDITENKYIESKLKESEEKYRTIVEYSNDLIWTEDIERKFTFCNKHAEKLIGSKLERLIGKSFSDFIVEEDVHKVNGLSRSVLNGQPIEFETTLINKNNRIALAVNKAPIYYKGNVIGVTAFGRDITQQKLDAERIKKTAEELERSNKELEQFAYIASHDLQEPLRTISNFTELLSIKYKNRLDQEADEFIDYIVSGSHRMQHMINDILVLSRVGTKGNKFELTNIKSVIAQSTKNLSNLIEKNQPIITVDDMPMILADEYQFVQLFQNLIDNAIKFRKENDVPKIYIKAKLIDNEWIFSVQDNGIGIDSKNFKKLFIIFQRLHSREKYNGTGIGLAICKKIVERHHGRIWVESKLGEGSTFYFSIPTAPANVGSVGERAQLAPAQARSFVDYATVNIIN